MERLYKIDDVVRYVINGRYRVGIINNVRIDNDDAVTYGVMTSTGQTTVGSSSIVKVPTAMEMAQGADVGNIKAHEAGAAQMELINFKSMVREKAIQVAREQGWCRHGLNETLEELGLEPYMRRHRARLTVEIVVEVSENGNENDEPVESDFDVTVNCENYDVEDVVSSDVTRCDIEEIEED